MIYIGLYLIGTAAFIHALILYYSDTLKNSIYTYFLLKEGIDTKEKLNAFQNDKKFIERSKLIYVIMLGLYGIFWPVVIIRTLYTFIILKIKQNIFVKKLKKQLIEQGIKYDVKLVDIYQLKYISFKKLRNLKVDLKNINDLQKEEEIQVDNEENKD